MKKLLAIVLAMVMILSLAACASKPADNTKPSDTKSTDNTTKATRTPVKRIDTCELIEQAIDHGTTVSFDISSVTARGEVEVARMTLRPFAIKQRDGISYLLGTVYDARGADDTLRTVEIGRMRNVTTRLLDGKKLFAALDEDDAASAA